MAGIAGLKLASKAMIMKDGDSFSMALGTQNAALAAPQVPACSRCGKQPKAGRAFVFKPPANGPVGEVVKCFGCAVQHWPMLKRSLTAAVVVGTVLTVLNQGDAIISGQWSSALFWKIPLTYCVPLLVATYGALSNSRK